MKISCGALDFEKLDKKVRQKTLYISGLSSLGVPGGTPQIFADQLTLSQPRGADYAHQIILAPPDFKTFRRPCNVWYQILVIIDNSLLDIKMGLYIVQVVFILLLIFYQLHKKIPHHAFKELLHVCINCLCYNEKLMVTPSLKWM